ncbi:hypothetical protein [Legionella hackeliae]|uniref:hypothetical protein n=1 Tax=Legionella hackeliae TaxID=449 RepID=UPI0011C05418|nr:hypothetical protein [Legionella hackeliae]
MTASDAFPLPARLLGDGTAGTTAGTRGDLMLPLLGSERGIVYGDLQGKYYRDESWFGGLAGGFRQTFGRTIIGSYLFADRSESANSQHFWSLNPGIEAMNAQWDAHLNGYFPVGDRSKTLNSAWADTLGNYNFVSFAGHRQFDHIFVDTETAGRGCDAEVGYRVQPLNNLRVAVGGYYFNFQDMNNMRGVIGTLEYPFNERVSVLAQDSYDNLQNNTFMLTVRLRFGAINPQEGHMLDPIRRNLGTLDRGTSIPTQRAWIDTGANLVEKDRLWFFKPGGETFDAAKGLANCTAEHPCTSAQLTQFEVDTINNLAPNSTLNLSTGVYLLDPTGNERLSLRRGQNIDGRTSDFVKEAVGNEKPSLIGGLDLDGFNNVSNIFLDSTITSVTPKNLVPNQAAQSVGEIIKGNATLRNVSIGVRSTYNLGIDILSINGARPIVSLVNSTVFARSNNSRTVTTIRANNANLNIHGGAILTRAINAQVGLLPVVATGIELNGRSELKMINGTVETIAVTATSNLVPIMTAQGLVVNDTSTFQISNLSLFTIRGISDEPAPTLIRAMGINNNSSTLHTGSISNTTFNITADARIGHASAWGIRQSVNHKLKLTDVTINRFTKGTSTSGVNIGP